MDHHTIRDRSHECHSKIGLAVTSHNNRVRNRSVFTNVALKLGASSPALTATQVYGQNGSFTDVTANNGGVSATSLNYPAGVVLDSNNNLYITDSINHRVLYYPAGSTTATRVYGQPDFTSNTVNNGGVSATSLNFPIGVALDSTNNLYISDFSNHRVLYYPADSTTATRVYGQGGSFTSNATGTDANSFKGSLEAAVDRAGNLYVADAYNNRVLLFAVS